MSPEELLDLLEEPEAFVRWWREVGAGKADEEMKEACITIMERDGVRAILPLVEKMDDLSSRMEEFTV